MHSSTTENYLKHLLLLQQQQSDDTPIPTGKLASSLEVTPGTATVMVKGLAESGLVDYESRGGVRLTRSGQKAALDVLRRHRLIELFLVRVLGLDWSEVHEEAEVLEHAVSEKVLDKIDQMLVGRPSTRTAIRFPMPAAGSLIAGCTRCRSVSPVSSWKCRAWMTRARSSFALPMAGA